MLQRLVLLTLLLAPAMAGAAPDFTVTSPGFFFAINGSPIQNPTLTLQAGQTYEFAVSTAPIHPFGLTTAPGGTVPFTSGVVGSMPTTSGTFQFTPPAQATDYALYYTCANHFFTGTIEVKVPSSADADADGVPDATDDCPATPDPGQADTGGLGAGSPPDGIGDACQCGDVSGDGRVTLSDAVIITRSLLQPPSANRVRPDLCDVGGPPSPTAQGCTLTDAVIIRRALLQPPTAAIQPVCVPSPPTPTPLAP